MREHLVLQSAQQSRDEMYGKTNLDAYTMNLFILKDSQSVSVKLQSGEKAISQGAETFTGLTAELRRMKLLPA